MQYYGTTYFSFNEHRVIAITELMSTFSKKLHKYKDILNILSILSLKDSLFDF